MRIRHLGASFLVVLALAIVALPAGHAGANPTGPSCYDARLGVMRTATRWLEAPGTLTGTNGVDVLVGSTGHDVIKGLGGNDVICTAPGATDVAGDSVDAGAGNDSIIGVGTLNGGSGDDIIWVSGLGSSANGGSGSDSIDADNGARADGGSGNDWITGSDASALLGGAGKDVIANLNGTPLIDCGSAYDTFATDDPTTIRRCEKEVDICEFNELEVAAVWLSDVEAQC